MEMRKATPQAARSLAKDVREVDRQEWELATRQPFLGHLLAGLHSPESHNLSLWDGEDCVAVFGVQPYSSNLPVVGRAWFAGSNRLMGRTHAAHHHFKAGIAELHAHYPVLVASSWERNDAHHEWMWRMGFTTVGFEFLNHHGFFVFQRSDYRCAPRS